jgi:integrase
MANRKMSERGKPVYRTPRGGNRIPVYRYADGRHCVAWRAVARGKLKRETFPTFEAAKARANEIDLAISNGRAEVLELTNAGRDSYLLAVRALEPFGVPLHSAIEEYVAARLIIPGHSLIEAANALHRGKVTSTIAPPTAQVLEEMLAQLKDGRPSPKYERELRSDLTRFADAFPVLTAADEKGLREYLRELRNRRGEPIGLRRRDNVRDAIVCLSRFARTRNYLPEDKISPAEKIKRLSDGGEIATFSPAELGVFLAHLSREWLPWFVIGAFAGLRTSEIFRLEWADIKWQQDVITVRRAVAKKVRVARMVPLLPALAAWLKPWRHARGPLYLKPDKEGGKIISWRALESRHGREIARLKTATGLPWETNALRHSFGSHRLAIVKSVSQVALEMGNSPAMVRENYHDPKSDAEAAAYFALIPPEEINNVVEMTLPLRFTQA